ncbi:P-loop containing nucleoside triphosphate hydrolase protein, partial [Dichomitus squalens]
TKVLGVSLRLSKKGVMEAIAIGTPDTAFLINLTAECYAEKSKNSSHDAGLAQILNNEHCLLAGFQMPRLALLLHRQTASHVYGIDLSTLHSKFTRKQVSAAELADRHLSNRTNQRAIHALWLRDSDQDICLRAWLSACISEKCITAIQKAAKIDTRHLPQHQLSCLSQLILNIELLEADKPTGYENDFEDVGLDGEGQVVLQNARFKTRVRKSRQTIIEINGGDVKLQAVAAKGRQTGLKVVEGKFNGKVDRVRVVGREELTQAELSRDEHILLVLQNAHTLVESPYVHMVWFPSDSNPPQGPTGRVVSTGGNTDAFEALNASQRKVANAMITDGEPLVIAHAGPPGTGKTTTIAAALEHWQNQELPVWVIAQSNVGVKNIALSLFKREQKTGHKINFKIIVSMEFHFEWHEYMYDDIELYLIRSDEFGEGFDPRIHIGTSKVILCTLSMLSHDALVKQKILEYVPMERLVVDEASQIDMFEFMHLFHKFDTLKKVCMFGDPKQLPPYGKEAAPAMQTIFDFKQFQKSSYFLDTQYRMPVPLGNFISKTIYDSKLKSEHKIRDFRTSSVLFVDVRKGAEERAGLSWK